MLKNIVLQLVVANVLALDMHELAVRQRFRKLDFSPGQKSIHGKIQSRSNTKNPHKDFYMFTPSLVNPETAPFIFYSMGGPGASAQTEEWMFNGPFNLSAKGYTKNPYAFNKFANWVIVDYPYGVGFSVDHKKSSKKYTHYNKLGKQSKRYTRFMINFFRKFKNYKNNKIWISGDSEFGDFFPSVMNYMKTHSKDRDVLDRAIGIINESPQNSPVQSLVQIPTMYREFHLINKKQEEKIVKKFKKKMENVKGKKFLDFYHDFEISFAKAANKKRYPGRWSDYYDLKTFIPLTEVDSPSFMLIPGLRVLKDTKDKISFLPLNLNNKKLQHTLGLPVKSRKGHLLNYGPFNTNVESVHWRYYAKANLRKQFKMFLENGYKYVAYFGQLDGCGNINQFMKMLEEVYSPEEQKEFNNTDWKNLTGDVYMKTFKNIWIANMGQQPHVIGLSKPSLAYAFLKKVLENW